MALAALLENAISETIRAGGACVDVQLERRCEQTHLRVGDSGSGLSAAGVQCVVQCLGLREPSLVIDALSQQEDGGDRPLLELILRLMTSRSSLVKLVVQTTTLGSTALHVLRADFLPRTNVAVQTIRKPDGSVFSGSVISVVLDSLALTEKDVVHRLERASAVWVEEPLTLTLRVPDTPPRRLVVQPMRLSDIQVACRATSSEADRPAVPCLPAMRDYLAARATEAAPRGDHLLASGCGCAVVNGSTTVHATVVAIATTGVDADMHHTSRSAGPASLLRSFVLLNNKAVVLPGEPHALAGKAPTTHTRRPHRPSVCRGNAFLFTCAHLTHAPGQDLAAECTSLAGLRKVRWSRAALSMGSSGQLSTDATEVRGVWLGLHLRSRELCFGDASLTWIEHHKDVAKGITASVEAALDQAPPCALCLASASCGGVARAHHPHTARAKDECYFVRCLQMVQCMEDQGMPILTKARRESVEARESAGHIARAIATIIANAQPHASEHPSANTYHGSFEIECLEMLDEAELQELCDDGEAEGDSTEGRILRQLLQDWSGVIDERDSACSDRLTTDITTRRC